jgi:cyanophycinase
MTGYSCWVIGLHAVSSHRSIQLKFKTMKRIIFSLMITVLSISACVEELDFNRPNRGGGGGGSDPGGAEPTVTHYLTGNATDVQTNTSFGILLAGGRTDQKSWFDWMVARSGGGDFVVIRTTDSNGYNDAELISGTNSIWTLVIDSREKANTQFVREKLRNAEALFITGGNQTEYYDFWKGTEVEQAIHYLVNTKKVPVGGTSAGMAILGEFSYIPSGTAVVSSEALRDPYHRNMNNIQSDFLKLPLMGNVITDSHFSERDRLGRTITFMARMIKDGRSSVTNTRAIAVDDYTGVGIDEQGNVLVMGDPSYEDYAFFFSANTAPNTCEPKKRLHWTNAVTAYKIKGSANPSVSFNVQAWSPVGNGAQLAFVNVNNGSITNDIQEPN